MLKRLSVLCFSVFFVYTGWAQTFHLPTPKAWTKESFKIPIEFAPTIPFTGIEEIRFSSGWANPESEELWSYCFLWWIEGNSKLDAALLKKYIEDYYKGLISANTSGKKSEPSKDVPVIASFREVKVNGNLFYAGQVRMLDYMNTRPVTLNIKVQIKECQNQKKRAVFFSISPKPNAHRIWKQFEEVWSGFKCSL